MTMDDSSSAEKRLEHNSRFILGKLEGNFEQDGKKTCQACLRSKALPCLAVVDLTTSSDDQAAVVDWTMPLVRRMHQMVLQDYTTFPFPSSTEEDNLINDTNNAPLSSALSCMSRATTGLRFVQLLLRLSEMTTTIDKTDNNGTAMTLTFMPDFLPAERNKMIEAVLEQWTEGISGFIRQAWKEQQKVKSSRDNDDNSEDVDMDVSPYDAMTADASLNLDPRSLFCFAFTSLLRMNDYIKTHFEMMVPVWKGLRGLADILVEGLPEGGDDGNDSTDDIPSSLLLNAMQILLDFVVEGKGRVATSAIQNLRNEAVAEDSILTFQSKMMCFLSTKLTQLMRIYFLVYPSCDNDEIDTSSKDVICDCWQTLYGLRGFATAFQLFDSATNKNPRNLSEGTSPRHLSAIRALCSISSIVGKNTQSLLAAPTYSFKATVNSMLESSCVAVGDEGRIHSPSKEVYHFEEISNAIGKVLLFHSILLTKGDTQAELMETLLRIVEDLLFVSIPCCQASLQVAAKTSHNGSKTMTLPSTLLMNLLRAMIDILLRFSKLPWTDNARMHRLLLSWLGCGSSDDTHGRKYPVCRETLLVLVQGYICWHQAEFESTDSLKPFLSLLTKIAFDGRAAPGLRRNIAALLVRLQASHNKEIQHTSRRLIEQQFERSFKGILVSVSSKKRKRQHRKKKGTLSDPDDLLVAAEVVTGHGLSNSKISNWVDLLTEGVCATIRGCVQATSETEGAPVTFTETHVLAISLVGRILWSGAKTNYEEWDKLFLEKFGAGLVTVVESLLRFVSTAQFHSKDNNNDFLHKSVLLTVALRLSDIANKTLGGNTVGPLPLDAITSLITKIGSKRFFPKRDKIDKEKVGPLFEFEALRILESLGKSIPSDCEDQILQVVKKSYTRLLSSNCWPCTSFGITSLVNFGSNLDTNHSHILRPCLPDSCLKQFQCRISKKPWKDKQLGKVEKDEFAIAIRGNELLSHLSPARSKSEGDFFPSPASASILPGSYVLEMPTQGGRTAQVIFPPGVQSMVDIKYMLGATSDDATSSLHAIKRFVVLPSGSLQCLMHVAKV